MRRCVPGPEGPPGKNRFKVFHSALFRMWGLGRLGKYRNAFGPQMDGRSGRLSYFGNMAPGACWPPGSVVCARVCMEEIIARVFVGIKGGCRLKCPANGGSEDARAEGLVGDTPSASSGQAPTPVSRIPRVVRPLVHRLDFGFVSGTVRTHTLPKSLCLRLVAGLHRTDSYWNRHFAIPPCL